MVKKRKIQTILKNYKEQTWVCFLIQTQFALASIREESTVETSNLNVFLRNINKILLHLRANLTTQRLIKKLSRVRTKK
jgi:hypothetical protein